MPAETQKKHHSKHESDQTDRNPRQRDYEQHDNPENHECERRADHDWWMPYVRAVKPEVAKPDRGRACA
jgi:hypothetical protein